MTKVALVLVAALNQGYWFGGDTGRISAQWAVAEPVPEARLVWEMHTGEVQLTQGQVKLDPKGEPSAIDIELPQVRARTAVRFTWRLVEEETAKTLDSGSLTVNLFPRNLLDDTGKLLADRHLVVWDKPTGVPACLKRAGIEHARIDDEGDLQFAETDIVLVGPDEIGDEPFDQSALLSLAESGRSVMIFAQRRPTRLVGYPLAPRKAAGKLEWRLDHPLLLDMDDQLVDSWLHRRTKPPRALRLPADAPVLEVAFWPSQAPADTPAPIDALLAVKAVGSGRIVFCQLPLGDWTEDPRSELLLRNALAYLTTRPEPTPPPSRRRPRPARVQPDEPIITIPSGVER